MIVLVLMYVAAVVSAKKVPPYNLSEGSQYFEDFIDTHNKVYSSDEEKAMRYQIFLKNLEEINELNAKNEHTQFGVNQFTDLTRQEFQAMHKCLKAPSEHFDDCISFTPDIKNISYPILPSFDWRQRNVVTRVKNQGNCNSCWAFSAVGNVESISAIQTGYLHELSEQQVVDCDSSAGGCWHGGMPGQAMKYLIQDGAMSAASYPYVGKDQRCEYARSDVAVHVAGCRTVTTRDEEDLISYLLAIGPLSIGVDATPLQHYHSGVLIGDDCTQNKEQNHAVLLVGYGVENRLSYWTVKNSWGEKFGEKGYFRIQRDVNCLGITGSAPLTAWIR